MVTQPTVMQIKSYMIDNRMIPDYVFTIGAQCVIFEYATHKVIVPFEDIIDNSE